MEKHEDNLGKLLKAELEKEAGEIMEEMDSDESLQDISFPEDLDEKMWSKIQEYEEQQKAYEKLSDDDKEAIRLGREVQALRGGENTKDHLKKDVESDSYIDNVVPIEYVKHETDNKASDDGTNEEIEKEAGKKKVRIHEMHMEEDAGKLIHDEWEDCSLVDYNRSGVPLIEIVSEPDMRSSEEVIAYLEKLRCMMQYLDVSDCKLQEGSMRADVNLSVREVGSETFGTELR